MMKNSMKKLLLASAIVAAPGVASAVTVTSSGITGDCLTGVCSIDVLAGASFNATFDDGDAAGNILVDLNNTSLTTQVVTLAVASVNQGGTFWGFRGGVELGGGVASASIAEGENWSDSFTFNIAAGDVVFFDWIYGDAYASGGAKPDIDFAVYASPVPVPAAVWLFGSGLIGLVGVARRRA